MTAELRRSDHPMLATLLTITMSSLGQTESPAADPTNVTDSAPHIDAMGLIKEAESVSIASRYGPPISRAPSNADRRSVYNDVQGTMNRLWHDKAEVAESALNALYDKHQEYPLGETIGSQAMGWLPMRF
ncbi:MAG: hypothetical protein Q8N04_09530 [Nitrospira sp.]|nr:hypothetical protein [Nitrospira sp.]